MQVELDESSLPISSVRSSLHTISVLDTKTDGDHGAASPAATIRRLRLDPRGDRRLNRDFILRFNVTDPAKSSLVTSLALSDDPGDESQEGTWQLTLLSSGNDGVQTNPRDVVFVLDRSGSMDGWKIEAARAALARMVKHSNQRFPRCFYSSGRSPNESLNLEAFDNISSLRIGPINDFNRQSTSLKILRGRSNALVITRGICDATSS